MYVRFLCVKLNNALLSIVHVSDSFFFFCIVFMFLLVACNVSDDRRGVSGAL